MAVQKSRVTRSKRGMRRAHDGLTKPTLSTDVMTGETHRRHHITVDGYYRGKQLVKPKEIFKEEKTEDETEKS
jgi:large subunit ribosomal protein L32